MNRMIRAGIDADAYRHNLRRVRERAPRSRVMAVIKSDAYGHGLIEAARALEATDAFAVARIGEALALRAAGIACPIVLLEGVFDQADLAAATQASLELVVHMPQQIELLRAAGSAQFRVWLKLDTGMNRLGFKPSEFPEAYTALSRLSAVRGAVNLLTHFSCADEPGSMTSTAQLNLFERTTRGLPGERSAANSAALWDFPQGRADWVRPGLLLYGVSPFADSTGKDLGLLPVMNLTAPVIAAKQLAAGERVGYGGIWTASHNTHIAIAGIGYSDGYPRSLPSGTPVLLHEERASIVGRVSMGMTAIDVSALDVPVQIGEPVCLWGPGLPVEQVASKAGASPYELLCGIGRSSYGRP